MARPHPRLFPLAAAVAAGLVFGSCQAKLATVEVEREGQVVIEKGTVLETLLGDLGFDGFTNLNITTAEEIENQGAEPGDIRDVMLGKFTMAATAPDGADLSFLNSVEIFVEAPELDRVRVAHSADFPVNEDTVELTLEDVDLTEYAVSESMTLSAEVDGNRPPEDTTVKASVVLLVGVTTQGVCNNL